MNRPIDLSTSSAVDAAVDRLVAGSLDEAGRRELLLHLDANPAGWRRCALAFLEEQAWQAALMGQGAQEVVTKLKPPSSLLPIQKPNKTLRLARYALAAGVLVATGVVGFRSGVASVERPAIEVVEVPTPPVEQVAVAAAEPGRPVGWVSVVNPAEGESLPRRIPVLEATAANEAWFEQQPAAISDYVKAQWERRGYLVEENRRLVGLDLEDGRRVAVPVDEVALDYVGRQPL